MLNSYKVGPIGYVMSALSVNASFFPHEPTQCGLALDVNKRHSLQDAYYRSVAPFTISPNRTQQNGISKHQLRLRSHFTPNTECGCEM